MECDDAIENTAIPGEIRKLQKSKQSLIHLAENEDWLAENFDKIIRSRDDAEMPIDRATVAKLEKHILGCLGAAVIMHWNTIPTKLQRELFDTAGSLGDVLQSAELRGQIARFLHDHKDEDSVTDHSSKLNMTKEESNDS